MHIGNRRIGEGSAPYVIAELSANHGQRFETALELVRAAKDAGCDAVKTQTFTAEDMTFPNGHRLSGGTAWDGKSLYKLYEEAATPRDWHPKLRDFAKSLGMDYFSTAYDPRSVTFLEEIGVPLHKIASFEIVDIPLIEKMAKTGKPLMISTGMATVEEISDAVNAARAAGTKEMALLKCTSAYPAPASEMNLRTIPDLRERFGVPIGLSDHSPGIAVAVASVAFDACIIEKHLILSRKDGGPDAGFSMEPPEFKALVQGVRMAYEALGKVKYGSAGEQEKMAAYRRSLYVVKPIRAGEKFTESNVSSLRPAAGLAPKNLSMVVGRRAKKDIEAGTPLDWSCVEKT